MAKLLGFSRVTPNSIDTVSDRDFLVEFVAGAALVMTHLSRLSEELILWSSSEFNMIRLHEEFTSGSSIMPQKRNPDALELMRRHEISGLPITQGSKPVGILTSRDLRFEQNLDQPVMKIMTRELITVPPGVSQDRAREMPAETLEKRGWKLIQGARRFNWKEDEDTVAGWLQRSGVDPFQHKLKTDRKSVV